MSAKKIENFYLNAGVVGLNEGVAKNRPTPILITGAARGGTSFVASVCHHLGLPMGHYGPYYENWFLQQAVTAQDWGLVRQLTQALSAAFPQWGWKLPMLAKDPHRVRLLFNGQQRFIFVMRNPLSVYATKFRLGLSADPVSEILKATQLYDRFAKFALIAKTPILFVSLEGAVANLSTCIQTIADYCDLPATNPSDIARRVLKDRESYSLQRYPGAPFRNELNDQLYRICVMGGKAFPGYPWNAKSGEATRHGDHITSDRKI